MCINSERDVGELLFLLDIDVFFVTMNGQDFISMFTPSLKIAGWMFLPFAIVTALVAAYFWYAQASRQWEWEKAPAVVTAVAPDATAMNTGNEPIKYAYMTFTAADGKEYTTRSQLGNSGQPIWHVGEAVEVIYPAGEPAEAEENLFLPQYILPIGITLVALMEALLTVVFFTLARRAERRQGTNCAA